MHCAGRTSIDNDVIVHKVHLTACLRCINQMGLRNVIDLTVVLLLCVQQTEVATARDEATELIISTRHGPARRVVRENAVCRDNISIQTDTSNANVMNVKSNVNITACKEWCIRSISCISVHSYNNFLCGRSDSTNEMLTPTPGFTFFRIEYRCPTHYSCGDAACKNGATCKKLNQSGAGIQCVCTGRWKGWFCDKKRTCLDNPCQNGATCLSTTQGFNCTCPTSWAGMFCERQYNCQDQPCKNGATCLNTTQGFNCTCPTSWAGMFCERRYSCTDQPCKHGGTCMNSTTGYSCTCPPSRTGVHCESATPEEANQLAVIVLGTVAGIGVCAILIAIAIIASGACAGAKALQEEA